MNKTTQSVSFFFLERVCGVGGRNIYFPDLVAIVSSSYSTIISHHEISFHPLTLLLYPEEFQKYFHIHFFLHALHLKCGILVFSASNSIKMNAWQYGGKIKQWSQIRDINIVIYSSIIHSIIT